MKKIKWILLLGILVLLFGYKFNDGNKKIVYEMRFDEVSARYGEFGSFFVGNILEDHDLERFLYIK